MKVNIINQIPEIKNCKQIIQLKKGFSSDKKYVIHLSDTKEKLILRTFSLGQLEAKKHEYSILAKMQDIGAACPKPIAFGEGEEEGYMILSYIEGNDAENEILLSSKEEQYMIGFKAGMELQKMHQLAAPGHIDSWYVRKKEKHEKYMKAYAACGVKIKNDKKIIEFINDNLHLMKQRPNMFQHDDFHLSNLIIHNEQFAGVIDFDRCDWGDPIHEFLKIGIFSRAISIQFSIGQIDGYFNGAEPNEDFWRLYSLYLAMCVFSSVVWTLNTVPDDLNNALDKIDRVLKDHDYFNNVQPAWYRKTDA